MRTKVGLFVSERSEADGTFEESPELSGTNHPFTKKHGLTIANSDEALLILRKVNYYRLSAYGIGLKDSKNPEMYLPGISLEHLYRLYAFDAHLRTLLIPVIEELEIELRTKIAYHLAMTYGSEGYRDPNHFLSLNNKFGESIHAKTMEKLDKEIFSQRTIPFVLHHQKKYGGSRSSCSPSACCLLYLR